MIGLGLKIQVNPALNEISSLLNSLQARATYFENDSGTRTILESLENC